MFILHLFCKIHRRFFLDGQRSLWWAVAQCDDRAQHVGGEPGFGHPNSCHQVSDGTPTRYELGVSGQ